MEPVEKISNIRERIVRNPNEFVISRVPSYTRTRFIEFCDEEHFCTDYGMGLKFLLDLYEGIIPTGLEHIENTINVLDERVQVIEGLVIKKEEEEKPKQIRKFLDGRKGEKK